ncbi:LamG domain-containing protein [Candidatus Poribacteria bacterium]|nr:LamG domain-containing protein [Candidatus Poribacteria bacterium]
MTISFKFLLIAFLSLSLVMPVFSFQPSGGVLSLDGVDDYAILSFEEHGYLFPKNTREFTVEMWFYPKSGPTNHGENDIILSQQVYFGLSANRAECKSDVSQLCCYGGAYLDGETAHGVSFFYAPMERDRWNYVAIVYKDSTFGWAYNNRIQRKSKFGKMDRVSVDADRELRDFFVGGYDQEMVRIMRFHGDIDAIRFSRIARYEFPDIPWFEEPFDPPHRFVRDRDTLALWNFDEREGETRFQDEVKKKRVLIGMNGASIGSALAVNPDSTSLTTTWGRIKSRSH